MPSRVAAAMLAAAVIAVFAAPATGQQKSAIGAKEKMEICKFGAKDQNLTGKAEKDFLKKCMANEDAPAKKTTASKPKSEPK